jgi:hypothetical protein
MAASSRSLHQMTIIESDAIDSLHTKIEFRAMTAAAGIGVSEKFEQWQRLKIKSRCTNSRRSSRVLIKM